jgi:hypothetical protein
MGRGRFSLFSHLIPPLWPARSPQPKRRAASQCNGARFFSCRVATALPSRQRVSTYLTPGPVPTFQWPAAGIPVHWVTLSPPCTHTVSHPIVGCPPTFPAGHFGFKEACTQLGGVQVAPHDCLSTRHLRGPMARRGDRHGALSNMQCSHFFIRLHIFRGGARGIRDFQVPASDGESALCAHLCVLSVTIEARRSKHMGWLDKGPRHLHWILRKSVESGRPRKCWAVNRRLRSWKTRAFEA